MISGVQYNAQTQWNVSTSSSVELRHNDRFIWLCQPQACPVVKPESQTNAYFTVTRTTDMDKARLPCLVGGVNRIGDKWRLFSVVFTAFRDWTKVWKKQFGNFLSPTVLTCRQFCSHRRHRQDRTRQSWLVPVTGVNYMFYRTLVMHLCPDCNRRTRNSQVMMMMMK